MPVILKMNRKEGQREPEVMITYDRMTPELKKVAAYVRAAGIRIRCKADGEEYFLPAADIYYIESVDKKCFLYGEKKVYQTGYKLYELEEELKESGFVRTSKSCILNIEYLETICPQMNSKLEIHLKNGERLFVTRKYLKDIKRMLERQEKG